MTNTSRTYELLAAFLYALEAEGYRMGTGTHLQLQEMVQRLPGDLSDEMLRDSIIPLLATNEQEQQLFRKLFQRAQNQVKSKHQPYHPSPVRQTARSIWQILFFAVLALILVLIAFLGRSVLDPELDPVNQHLTLKPGEVSDAVAPDSSALEGLSAPVVFMLPQKKEAVLPRFLQFEMVDEGARVQFTAPDTAITDTLELVLRGDGRRFRTIYLIATVEATLETGEQVPEVQARIDTPVVSPELLEPVAPVFRARELPYASDIRSLEYTPPDRLSSFLARNIGWLRWVFIILAAQLVVLWAKWREERRRKLVTTPEERTNPPYVWNIELPDLAGAISLGDGIQRVLTRLRRRAYDEREKLDMSATIRATVRRGGMADFRYQPLTRPPEYLLLIDRQSGRSHRAALFDYLFEAFRQQDVVVERFFFQGDIRACTNELYPEGISLRELHHRYPSTRLLIISDGYRLLNARTGKVNTWASRLLGNWKEYALLTPRPPGAWGRRERLLRNQLPVVSATLQSLTFLLEQWSARDEADFDQWPAYVEDVQREPIVLEGDLMSTLEKHYDPAMQQWIAGCAIYPELHWDLTLLIGRTMSTSERSLLTLDSVQELLRLPWFNEGRMPEAARLVLLDWLQRAYPDTETRLREVIHEQFQQQEPPADSVAYEPYRLQMAFNEWRITRDRKRKRQLEQEMEQLLEQGQEADMVMIRYLEGDPGPMDLVLPDRFKKYVYKGGYRKLGSRESQRDLRWASMLWLGLSIASFWVTPTVDDCSGQTRSYMVPTVSRPLDSLELPNYNNAAYDLIGIHPRDSALILGAGQELVRYYIPNQVFSPLGLPNRPVDALSFAGIGVDNGSGPTRYSMIILQDGQLLGLVANGRGGYASNPISEVQTIADLAPSFQPDRIPVAYRDGRVALIDEEGNPVIITQHEGVEHIAAPYLLGARFATTATDSSLIIWDQNLEELHRIQLPYRAEKLRMSWNSQHIATQGDGFVDVWNNQGGLVYTSRSLDLIALSGAVMYLRQADKIYVRNFTLDQTVTQFAPSGDGYQFGRGYSQLFALNPAGTHVLRWGTTTDAFDEIEICLSSAADTALYREHRARQFAFHGQFEALDAELFQLDSAHISDSLRRARTANIATVLYNRALLALEEADTAFACALIDRAIAVDGSRTPIYLRAQEAFCSEPEEDDLPPGAIEISGVVVDAYSGAPISGVLVRSGEVTVQTDADGRFDLLDEGQYEPREITLNLEKAGYISRAVPYQQATRAGMRDVGPLELTPLEQNTSLRISQKGDRYGLQRGNQWVLEPKYSRIEQDPQSGFFRLTGTEDNGERPVGMANAEGELVVPLAFKQIRFPKGGFMAAQLPRSNLWGHIDVTTGESIAGFDFEEVGPFENGQASVTYLGNRFYMDRNGLCVQDCPDAVLTQMLEGYLQGNIQNMATARTTLLNHPQLDRLLTVGMAEDFLGDFEEFPASPSEGDIAAFERLQELFYASEGGLTPDIVAKYQQLFRLLSNPPGKVQDMSGELPPPIAGILPEMVEVSGGTFTMGCVEERDGECSGDELPAHEVTVGDFAISKYEITNRQYATFLNMASSQVLGSQELYDFNVAGARIRLENGRYVVQAGYEQHPVTHVNWHAATAFAKWLSDNTGDNYRLPSEAEWEYAARGGEKGASQGFRYAGSNTINEVAWYDGNSKGTTHPVGQKEPNQLGVHDMSGNVYEWVEDCWHGDYTNAPEDGSSWGSDNCSHRVFRGGSWVYNARYCRAARRIHAYPDGRDDDIGFRLALSSM